jgi:hypothetical protein
VEQTVNTAHWHITGSSQRGAYEKQSPMRRAITAVMARLIGP